MKSFLRWLMVWGPIGFLLISIVTCSLSDLKDHHPSSLEDSK